MAKQPQIEALDAALSALIRTYTINERQNPAAEGKATYSPHDFETLGYLDARPGAPAKALGAHLGTSPTTTQSIVDRLEKRGLVRRDQQALKGRAVAIFLTGKGQSLQASIKRQNLLNCEQMLNALPDRERAAFVRSITRIVETVSRPLQA